MKIELVKILQELTESEAKAYPKHQRERWTNTSPQTIKLQMRNRVSSSFPNRWKLSHFCCTKQIGHTERLKLKHLKLNSTEHKTNETALGRPVTITHWEIHAVENHIVQLAITISFAVGITYFCFVF